MADHDDLRRTIASLRRDVPMRPEWRRAVLRDIEALTPAFARTAAPAARRDVRRG